MYYSTPGPGLLAALLAVEQWLKTVSLKLQLSMTPLTDAYYCLAGQLTRKETLRAASQGFLCAPADCQHWATQHHCAATA